MRALSRKRRKMAITLCCPASGSAGDRNTSPFQPNERNASMSREWGADIKDIGDKIAGLTVSKAVELGDYLEDVHKIKPAAGGGGVVMAAAPVAAAAVAAGPTEFRVILGGFDPAQKVHVLKGCRE